MQIYYSYKEMVNKAEAIATEAHKDQKRDDGQPYISHPKAMIDKFLKTNSTLGRAEAIILMLLWTHDVWEDCADQGYILDKGYVWRLFDMKIPTDILDDYFNALVCLTKKKGEPYVEFIRRVLDNWYACQAKLIDLWHNLSDSKPGARKDKYQLAEYIINRELQRDWITRDAV